MVRDPTVDGGMDPGPCHPDEITNDANSWIIQVSCPAGGLSRLRVSLGDREDHAELAVSIPVALSGGFGTDTLTSGDGNDVVTGDDGNDTVLGRGGNDQADGGDGNDRVVGRARGRHSPGRTGPGSARGRGRQRRSALAGRPPRRRELRRRLRPSGRRHAGRDHRRLRVGDPHGHGPAARGLELGRRHGQAARAGRRCRPCSGSAAAAGSASPRAPASAERSPPRASWTWPGLSLPLISNRRRVAVAGGGVTLTVRLKGRELRAARRALRRHRRVVARLSVVATDSAGNSATRRMPLIRLRR